MKREVVFFGAGKFGERYYKNYVNLFGKPVCFVDTNIEKHGYELFGVKVLPLQLALEKYPNCKLVLTVSPKYSDELEALLMDSGIEQERIIICDILKGIKQYLMARYNSDSTDFGLNRGAKREKQIIVSFTTYPARIDCAKYVADIMLRQTLLPDKVIMVLTKEEFQNHTLPSEFENLIKRGLTVQFTDDNFHVHNKYLYAMTTYPDDIVITVDDDIFYSETMIEELYDSHLRYPNAVSAKRVHQIIFDEENKLKKYTDWNLECKLSGIPQMDLLATGVGGVLYPPHCMHTDLLNKDLINRLCLQDDIWLKFMQLLVGTLVVKTVEDTSLLFIGDSQNTARVASMFHSGGNDICIRDVMNYYGLDDAKLKSMIAD